MKGKLRLPNYRENIAYSARTCHDCGNFSVFMAIDCIKYIFVVHTRNVKKPSTIFDSSNSIMVFGTTCGVLCILVRTNHWDLTVTLSWMLLY